MKRIVAVVVVSLFAASAGFADTIINEKFSADPLQNGWQIFGDTNLFQWDSTNQLMDVTWDSSQTNSYFYHPLGRTFTPDDGFCVQFDLNLTDTDATNYFQLAIGLCNYTEATSANFSRANFTSPDLFEFDYYPDGPDSYGPSIDATLIDANSGLYFAFDNSQPMATNTDYRVVLIHPPGTSIITCTVYTNGQVFSWLPAIDNYGTAGFNLDTLAIMNYTTLDDFYGDSLLAHGTVSHLSFASPLPIGAIQTPAAGQVQFGSDTNWLYTLEQSADFQTWSSAAPTVSGNGTNLMLQATNPPADNSFYHVRADLP
ncbi:MAG TPA: hypothetical protein VK742_01625 [Candidatus Sulfotelmatobacter sp.]|nr:hypothetical protein [Candidatus Sulfotelmatobacter sp.]